jgi:hypothetical protein
VLKWTLGGGTLVVLGLVGLLLALGNLGPHTFENSFDGLIAAFILFYWGLIAGGIVLLWVLIGVPAWLASSLGDRMALPDPGDLADSEDLEDPEGWEDLRHADDLPG